MSTQAQTICPCRGLSKDVPVLDLITQDLVNKLSNCESTYPERIDDVRDEMINKIDMGDW